MRQLSKSKFYTSHESDSTTVLIDISGIGLLWWQNSGVFTTRERKYQNDVSLNRQTWINLENIYRPHSVWRHLTPLNPHLWILNVVKFMTSWSWICPPSCLQSWKHLCFMRLQTSPRRQNFRSNRVPDYYIFLHQFFCNKQFIDSKFICTNWNKFKSDWQPHKASTLLTTRGNL